MLCSKVEDLLADDLQSFVSTLFERCMVTSTFVEKTFAPMTQFTSEPRSRVSLPLLQAHHVNTIFDETVQAWWKTMLPDNKWNGKCRGPAAYHHAEGSHTCAWHLYTKGPAHEPGIVFDKERVLGIVTDKRAEFMALSSAEKQPWEEKAARARRIARVRQAPVAREAAYQLEADVLGGLGRSHRGEVACQEIGLCIAPTSAELWRRPRSLK